MIQTSVCAAPWDILRDPEAPGRFAAFGAGSVTLAAAYHGVRAATPRHLSHRFIDAPHSALYLPVREEAWSGLRLRPSSAERWMGDTDSFGTARLALAAEGVPAAAWVVLTHDDPSDTDGRDSELRVQTAFGDRLPYALCPSSDDVVQYCATLVAEVAATGVDEIMLEAVGQLGLDHGGAHEKIAGADWTAVDKALLSVCFCASCRGLLARAGVDADAAAAVVRAAVGSGVGSLEDALGEMAQKFLALRRATTATLLEAVTSAARAAGTARLTAHTGLDPWATSSFSPLEPGPVPLDALVFSDATVDDLSAADIASIKAETGASVAGYVSAMPPRAADDLADHWGGLIERGLDELVIYHGGLISAPRAAAVAAAIEHVAHSRAKRGIRGSKSGSTERM